jgi:YVTN family beta-propeller protein
VSDFGSGVVTAIATATGRVTAQITVGRQPQAIAITPNGSTAYVANFGSASISPIDTATNKAGLAIPVGSEPYALAIVPHHQSMYVINYASGTVTPISTTTNKAGPAIRVGTDPEAVALTANGGTALVANEGSNSDTKIDTGTGGASTFPVGDAPVSVFIVECTGIGPGCDPDYKPIYGTVCDNNSGKTPSRGYFTTTPGTGEGLNQQGDLRPMSKRAGQPGGLRRIPLGLEPGPLAFSAKNATLYIVNEGSNDVTPLRI